MMKMKSIGIVIMMIIMLGYTQAKNLGPRQSCATYCFFNCLISDDPYPVCHSRCKANCHEAPPSIYSDCISSCSVTKSSYNNMGIYFLTTLISFLIFHSYYLLLIWLHFYICLIINFYVSDDHDALMNDAKSCLQKCHIKLWFY